jgi:hypothetical protein
MPARAIETIIMKEVEILLFEEGVAEPHKQIATEEITFGEVLSVLRGRGTVVGELFFFEGENEVDLKGRVGGAGHRRVLHACKQRQHRQVPVEINGTERLTHIGKNSVEHLRAIGEVPADEVLSEFKDGAYVDLGDNAHVEIRGGEIFTSHVKTGKSS